MEVINQSTRCANYNMDPVFQRVDLSMNGFPTLGSGYYIDFVNWLEDWLEDHGLDPTATNVLPAGKEFTHEQWIEAITDEVSGIVNPQ